jgi:Ni/Co efflux regulator RcnB
MTAHALPTLQINLHFHWRRKPMKKIVYILMAAAIAIAVPSVASAQSTAGGDAKKPAYHKNMSAHHPHHKNMHSYHKKTPPHHKNMHAHHKYRHPLGSANM